MKRSSKRFAPSRWMELIVPAALAMLAVGLLAVFVLVGLSLLN